MEIQIKKCIYSGFVLREYLRNNFGEHIPYEIIQIIISMTFPKISISCGNCHTHILLDDDLYVAGCNDGRRLGLNENISIQRKFIKSNIGLKNIKKISSGHYHTIILNKLGEIYAYGSNDGGQLGFGSYTNNYNVPKKIDLDGTKIIKISCGYKHNIALSDKNEIWAWGANNYGQLGLGDFNDRCLPEKVSFLENIIKIACGTDHTLALNKYGELYAWGYNHCGQLGMRDFVGKNNIPQKVNLSPEINIRKISCNDDFSMILTKTNEVWIQGSNKYGGIEGHEDINPLQKVNLGKSIRKISSSAGHVMVLDKKNKIYAWGCNERDQLALGDYENRYTQTKNGLKNIVKVICGDFYTIFVNLYGEIYVSGSNSHGQIGLPTRDRKNHLQKLEF